MDDNKLIPIPLWVLRSKVEMDFQEYMFLHDHEPGEYVETENSKFPEYASTIKILEVLKEHGVEFNTRTGLWKE